ncbi:MAG TPA: response regulator, partial [Candidatus Binatia bacterium]
VQQLLTFAQEKTIEHKRVDLNGLISDLMRMMVNTFPRTVAFALELDPEIPPILADQNQLEQALLNLCLNARDAMVEGGKISLRTARLSGEEVRRTHPEAGEKEYVRVEVADTGPGMDDETRNRIFEPFFTTKKDTGGTGLGLPVVYGIVGSHRGLIDVESAKGKGSAFRIYLPVSAAESAAGEKGEESAGLAGPAGRILVVEDEKNLLQLIQSVLKKNRYEVFTATHGEQAIEIFRRHKDAVDLVLLDLGLPGGMDGRKVYDKLKEESPRVTVIVSTGYLDPEVRIDLIKKGVNGFLQKPLTPMMILQKIRSVLERQSTLAKRGKTDALAS